MDYKIEGDNLQVLRIFLKPDEEVYAEAGKMVYKTNNVKMDTKMQGGSLGEKIWGAVKRKIAGESLFTTHFTLTSGTQGEVGFAGDYPGRIQPIDVSKTAFLAQKDAFIAAEKTVSFTIAFQKKIGAGLFGGEGFILEKFTGNGLVFIHAGGDFITFDLQPGETMQIDTGSVVGFEETVNYDIEFVGGIKTAIFGGEGLFLTTVKGPGKVILQSMTLSKLRRELGLYAAKPGGGKATGLGAVLDILSGSND